MFHPQFLQAMKKCLGNGGFLIPRTRHEGLLALDDGRLTHKDISTGTNRNG